MIIQKTLGQRSRSQWPKTSMKLSIIPKFLWGHRMGKRNTIWKYFQCNYIRKATWKFIPQDSTSLKPEILCIFQWADYLYEWTYVNIYNRHVSAITALNYYSGWTCISIIEINNPVVVVFLKDRTWLTDTSSPFQPQLEDTMKKNQKCLNEIAKYA